MADNVGPAADERRKRSLLESVGVHGVLGQHRHEAEDERQLAVIAAGEIEAHRPLADHLRLGDLGIVDAMVRSAFRRAAAATKR